MQGYIGACTVNVPAQPSRYALLQTSAKHGPTIKCQLNKLLLFIRCSCPHLAVSRCPMARNIKWLWPTWQCSAFSAGDFQDISSKAPLSQCCLPPRDSLQAAWTRAGYRQGGRNVPPFILPSLWRCYNRQDLAMAPALLACSSSHLLGVRAEKWGIQWWLRSKGRSQRDSCQKPLPKTQDVLKIN